MRIGREYVVFLHRLTISGFRNLASQSIDFDKRVAVVTGMNGQGKTSLLEAIYLLAHSKSFRSAKNRELISWDLPASEKPQTRIEAEISTIHGRQSLVVEIRNTKRQAWLNGKEIDNVLGFYGQVKAVIFTPEELQLVKGPPRERRSFVDRTLAMVDPVFVENAVHYQRALKNRNALLALRDKRDTVREELVFWDSLLVKHGRIVAARRMAFVDFLRSFAGETYGRLARSGERREKISVSYESDFLNEAAELKSEADLEGEFLAGAEQDLRHRSTTFGIHRDDVVLTLDTGSGPHPARSTASQGQARTLALALKLCALRFLKEQTEDEPILLLDDVESELDESRRAALFELLERSQSQVLLTGAQVVSDLKNLGPSTDFWRMEKGLLEPFSGPKFNA